MLALTLALLAIPYVGYQYVREMEQFMRNGLEDSVLGAAKALAGALHGRPGLFPAEDANSADIHAHPLRAAPELDGYAQDWNALARRLTPIPWQAGVSESVEPPRYAAGRYRDHAYLLIQIPDKTRTQADPLDRLSGDHVVVRIIDTRGYRHHYLLDTATPGPVEAHELLLDPLGQPIAQKEIRIQGVMRSTSSGTTVEIRIPLQLIGARLGLQVTDHGKAGEVRKAATASESESLGLFVRPSDAIDRVIEALGRTEGRRIWIVDTQHRVLARGGSLWRPASSRLHPWLTNLLGSSGRAQSTDPGPVDRIESPQISQAVKGQISTRWQSSTDGELLILSVAHPIWARDMVVGAVLVEESSTPIQIARNDALLRLLLITLIVFIVAAGAMAWFASNLSRRLNRLQTAAQAAIDAHGRVVGSMDGLPRGDEIGDLGETFADLLHRLNEYNHYLERLAARLSHELRTPLAVIRSSLDNLELDPRPEVAAQYLQRARSGIARLQIILTRMSEASRIEEAVRSSEPEDIDLAALVQAAVSGYVDAWPAQVIELTTRAKRCRMSGSPDLVVQMLDKLVSNAVDFSAEDAAVEISLEAHANDSGIAGFRLAVTNHGARLPHDLGSRLFESMVSSRPRTDGSGAEPHLGLGLYVVRLIVEHHLGYVRALQHSSPDAVTFEVWLPAAD
jgi:two-component system, OmpR family, sensor histidine kinase ChvG